MTRDWSPTPKQVEWATEGINKLLQYRICYYAMQERAGKSIPALLAAIWSGNSTILVVTKNEAIAGWHKTIAKLIGAENANIRVVNYQQCHKYSHEYNEKRLSDALASIDAKYKKLICSTNCPDNVDELEEDEIDEAISQHDETNVFLNELQLVIVDEAHWGVSGFPFAGTAKDEQGRPAKRNSGMWQSVRDVCEKKPIIYCSATPHAEGYQKMYNQLKLSDYNPITIDNPYAWWKKYGISATKMIGGAVRETYTRVSEIALEEYNHIFVRGTRAEAGHTYEPENEIIKVNLDEKTGKAIKALKRTGMAYIGGYQLIADNISKERTLLHQLEGGTAKLNEEDTIVTGDRSKVGAINAKMLELQLTDGDIAIMYNFTAEEKLLRDEFPQAELHQASKVTGFDLYHKKALFIYSQDYSASNHSQRVSRMCHTSRDEPIIVWHLLVSDAISEEVYDCVVKKHCSFTASIYAKLKETR